MTNGDRLDGVVEAVSGLDDPTASHLGETLALLGDARRVAIIGELAASGSVPGESSTLSFSQLRWRVGVSDSGQFNYHLGKLRGQFVVRVADGYQLTDAGAAVGEALVAADEDGALEAVRETE